MSPIVTTGATHGTPNRLEIHDFVKNEKFFSLYIQAIQAMSSDPQPNTQSFFQMGGIHGLPYVPWDGVTGDNPPNVDEPARWGGYCTHGSVLFPTWHRPYMMLYEQIMQKHAISIAATYTVDCAAWTRAALELRHPYWDWAANVLPPDEVIALKTVTITGPHGTKISVENPLYHYAFNPVDPSFKITDAEGKVTDYTIWTNTLRHPTTAGADAQDDVPQLKATLQANQSHITQSTYTMLTQVKNWTDFSTHVFDGNGKPTGNSLEAIHDGLHFYVGGAGHMGVPALAAFDPIFFMHHCAVDRLLSLWAAINPSVWTIPGNSSDGTWILPGGEPVDEHTALTPFRNAQTTFWASSSVRDTAKLGYTYPEFNGLDMGNVHRVKEAISRKVNRLYGNRVYGDFTGAAQAKPGVSTGAEVVKPGVSGGSQHPLHAGPAAGGHGHGHGHGIGGHHHPEEHQHAAEHGHGGHGHPLAPHVSINTAPAPGPVVSPDEDQAPDQGLWDWTARIQVRKFELGRTFNVLIFLGTVPENPRDWALSPSYVGSHVAFANAVGSCANCAGQREREMVIEGYVHLNRHIVKYAPGVTRLDPEVVEPYLKEAIHWRVQTADGTPVEIESLEVTVYATPLSYPPGAMFPVAGERRGHSAITHGRRGGCRTAV